LAADGVNKRVLDAGDGLGTKTSSVDDDVGRRTVGEGGESLVDGTDGLTGDGAAERLELLGEVDAVGWCVDGDGVVLNSDRTGRAFGGREVLVLLEEEGEKAGENDEDGQLLRFSGRRSNEGLRSAQGPCTSGPAS
jgi:hypothetical protein